MSINEPTAPDLTKPDELPRFADQDAANGPEGENNVSEPSSAKKDQGWDVGERPAREFMNWIHRKSYEYFLWIVSWVDHIRNEAPIWDSWSINAASTSGLDLALNPGTVRIQTAGVFVTEGTTAVETVTLDDDETNIVYYDTSANQLDSDTSGSFTAAGTKIPLYQIVTASGVINWGHASTLDLRTPHFISASSANTTVYAGFVHGADGTVGDGNDDLPAGWSVVKDSDGRFTVTHGAGVILFPTLSVVDPDTALGAIVSNGVSGFTVDTGSDRDFYFVVVQR